MNNNEDIDLHSPGCAIYDGSECDCIVSKKKKKKLSDEEKKEKGK